MLGCLLCCVSGDHTGIPPTEGEFPPGTIPSFPDPVKRSLFIPNHLQTPTGASPLVAAGIPGLSDGVGAVGTALPPGSQVLQRVPQQRKL